MNSREIARLAKVSQSTVSRVLNGMPGVSEDKRQRVLDVVQRTNFQLNVLARNLKTNKVNRVGVLMPDYFRGFDVNLMWSLFYTKLHEKMSEIGYTTNVFYGYHGEQVETFIAAAARKEIDCCVMISTDEPFKEEFVQRILDLDVTCVCVYNIAKKKRYSEDVEKRLNIIEFDYISLGTQGADFLYEHGHRDILMYNDSNHGSTNTTFECFKKEIKKLDKNVVIETVKNKKKGSGLVYETGYKMVDENIDKIKKNTVIVTGADAVAIGVLSRLPDYGISVPDKISVLGMSNISISPWWRPALTTFNWEMDEIINTIGDFFSENAKGERVITKPTLIVRESVKKL